MGVTSGAEDGQHHFPAIKTLKQVRELGVAYILEFGHGSQAVGVSGIPCDEHQIILGQGDFAPLEEVGDLSRLAVFVSTEKADIQIKARVLEVIGVTAIESN